MLLLLPEKALCVLSAMSRDTLEPTVPRWQHHFPKEIEEIKAVGPLPTKVQEAMAVAEAAQEQLLELPVL